MAGAEGLEPSARGFGATVEVKKADCNAVFKPFLNSCQNIKIVLMLY